MYFFVNKKEYLENCVEVNSRVKMRTGAGLNNTRVV